MKFYLSSYKLGDRTVELKRIIAGLDKKTAYISNALDFSFDSERREKSEAADVFDLEAIGMQVDRVDLRDFFGKKVELEKKLKDYNIIWVRGGNVFVLRQAMMLSGFDELMEKWQKREDLVYGAYSAGVCVLAPTLKGLDLVDDPDVYPYPGQVETIWEGLGILDYSVVPHYDSDHAESDEVNEVVKYLKENKIPFKVIRDGEVIIF
jgi:dipeptidase E